MRVKSQESRVPPRRAGISRQWSSAERSWSGPRLSTLDSPPSRGLTLIELLVVIVILTTLVAAAIPLMTPSNDDRRIREASRGVNAYITGAQMKAVQLRRPYGVALKKLSQDTESPADNGVCVELVYVEQPPAYLGFDENSTARVGLYAHPNPNSYGGLRPLVLIQFVTRGNTTAAGPGGDGLPNGWDADFFPPNMIRPGDVIEFNGNRYELMSDTDLDTDTEARFTDPPANTFFAANTGVLNAARKTPVSIVARPLSDTGQMINVKYDNQGNELASGFAESADFRAWTMPAKYKIYRQPMPTSAEPYQLPEGTAIDLRATGVGINDYFYVPDIHDNDIPAIIMFSPEGSVSRVRFGRTPGGPNPNDSVPFNEPVTDTIFLLVGRREIIPAPLVDVDKTLDGGTIPLSSAPDREQLLEALRDPVNWLRGESRWIAIGAQSGRVVTTENGFVPITGNFPATSATAQARRNDQIRQAREFARQMTQMGGG